MLYLKLIKVNWLETLISFVLFLQKFGWLLSKFGIKSIRLMHVQTLNVNWAASLGSLGQPL